MYKLEIAAFNCALDDNGEYILDAKGNYIIHSSYSAYTAFRVSTTDIEAVLAHAEEFKANVANTTQLDKDVLKFPEDTGFSYKVIKSSNTGYIDDNGVLKKIPASTEPAFNVELKVEIKLKDASTTVRVPVTIQPAAAPTPTPTPTPSPTPSPSPGGTPTPAPSPQPKPTAGVNPSIPAVISKGQIKVEVGTSTEKNGIGITVSMKDEDLTNSIKSAGNSAAAFVLSVADTGSQQLKATISPSQVQVLAQAPAQSTLVVNSEGSSVSLPVSLMSTVPSGSGVEVVIAPDASKQVLFTSQAAGSSVLGSPVSYEVNVVSSQGSTPITASKTPIKRSFTVDGVVQPGTAGVLYEEAGVVHPVASVFAPQDNGTTIVKVSRPGFSTYAAVTRPVNFKDISASWAKTQIQSMASKLLINGTSAETFSPKANVTRAEFASILARSLGLTPQAKTTAVFTDVPSGAWYAADVAAAYEAGLIQGTGNGKFDPNAPLTREQLSVILSKAISLLNISTSNPSHTTYGDTTKVSGYAKDSVQTVTEAGLMQGEIANGISYFRPGAITSRDMAAATIWQLLVKAQMVE
ncbi:Endo-1,4-beta-xylanase A precursor [compost metagenome]